MGCATFQGPRNLLFLKSDAFFPKTQMGNPVFCGKLKDISGGYSVASGDDLRADIVLRHIVTIGGGSRILIPRFSIVRTILFLRRGHEGSLIVTQTPVNWLCANEPPHLYSLLNGYQIQGEEGACEAVFEAYPDSMGSHRYI